MKNLSLATSQTQRPQTPASRPTIPRRPATPIKRNVKPRKKIGINRPVPRNIKVIKISKEREEISYGMFLLKELLPLKKAMIKMLNSIGIEAHKNINLAVLSTKYFHNFINTKDKNFVTDWFKNDKIFFMSSNELSTGEKTRLSIKTKTFIDEIVTSFKNKKTEYDKGNIIEPSTKIAATTVEDYIDDEKTKEIIKNKGVIDDIKNSRLFIF